MRALFEDGHDDPARRRALADGGALAAEYMEASPPQPVVLTHALDAWPALTTRPWCDTVPALGVRRAARARRTCAVDDATQTYLSGSFAQRVMSLGDFIAQYFEAGRRPGRFRRRRRARLPRAAPAL